MTPTEKTCLIVDDDAPVADAIFKMVSALLPKDWSAAVTTEPELARELLLGDASIGMAFVDICMPGLSGVVLIEQVIEGRPALRGKIVVCSGGILTEIQERVLFVELGCLALPKPFHFEDLEKILSAILMPSSFEP